MIDSHRKRSTLHKLSLLRPKKVSHDGPEYRRYKPPITLKPPHKNTYNQGI
jgi:hypothetical protein